MRSLWVLSVVLLLVTGCRGASKVNKAKPGPVAKSEIVSQKPSVRPVDAIRGRVVTVREDLRFLIADFAGAKMPRLDQQLSVYRLDQKVAEIKVSGPYRGTTVAADIVAGEARMGDLVRDR
jgi:hypothetical protein